LAWASADSIPSVTKMESRAALHLDGRPGVVGEDEGAEAFRRGAGQKCLY